MARITKGILNSNLHMFTISRLRYLINQPSCYSPASRLVFLFSQFLSLSALVFSVESALFLMELVEAMLCVLLCILEDVEGGVCLLKVFEVPEVPEVMRCVLLSML